MINLGEFNLEKITYKKHGDLIKKLANDFNVYNYINKNFESFLDKHKSVSDEVFETDKVYVIVKDGIDIGFLGSSGLVGSYVEPWCAISSEFRNNGYATKILEEFIWYLINNKEIIEVNGIKLEIHKNNKASIKTAVKNGFELGTNQENQEKQMWFCHFWKLKNEEKGRKK